MDRLENLLKEIQAEQLSVSLILDDIEARLQCLESEIEGLLAEETLSKDEEPISDDDDSTEEAE